MGVDEVNNTLDATIVGASDDELAAVGEELNAIADVPVRVTSVRPGGDVSCTDREHCASPMKAGIIIREGTWGGSPPCTLALPILVGSDIQALTAGHCGYYGAHWYHSGYTSGQVGQVLANKWQSGGRDILRMSFLDSQASEMVYGMLYTSASNYGTASNPILNDTVCVSMGNRRDCARVEKTSVKYWSDTVGFYVWGAKLYESELSPAPINGDSGSPVSRDLFINKPGAVYWYHTPIGVLATEFGEFATLPATLSDWSAVIWQG